jgi:hypothetical protein
LFWERTKPPKISTGGILPVWIVTMLHSSSASVLIERIAQISRKQFRDLLTQLQRSGDPAEVERLKRQVDQAIFGRAAERICLTG